MLPFLTRFAVNLLQPPRGQPHEAERIDPLIYAKAEAAAEAATQHAAAELDAIRRDCGLRPEQKAAAIAAAKQRHRAAASAARRRVIDDEKARARAARRLRQKPQDQGPQAG